MFLFQFFQPTLIFFHPFSFLLPLTRGQRANKKSRRSRERNDGFDIYKPEAGNKYAQNDSLPTLSGAPYRENTNKTSDNRQVF